MTEGLRTAVAALDKEYGPLWDESINLGRLQMFSLNNCILGQLDVDDWTGTVTRLVGWDASTLETPTAYFSGHDYEWRQFIEQRRAERG